MDSVLSAEKIYNMSYDRHSIDCTCGHPECSANIDRVSMRQMTIHDIVKMPIKERSIRLVGDMPWVTEKLSNLTVADLVLHIEAAMMAVAIQTREECAKLADTNHPAYQIRDMEIL